jgi:uncharacterized protein involved in oxidation of intracellular sulfur
VKVLFIVNDAPYGSEKVYNTLRLAMALQREHPDVSVRIFLLADAVTSALPNQATPEGYYNVQHMLQSVVRKGGVVSACGFAPRREAGLKEAASSRRRDRQCEPEWVTDFDKSHTF